jgi:hypothetical protein
MPLVSWMLGLTSEGVSDEAKLYLDNTLGSPSSIAKQGMDSGDGEEAGLVAFWVYFLGWMSCVGCYFSVGKSVL